MDRAKSATPLQSKMARRLHGPVLEVENLLIMWTNQQKYGTHISLNQVMSFAKEFSLLEMLRNRRVRLRGRFRNRNVWRNSGIKEKDANCQH
jgi:hypothetical protein